MSETTPDHLLADDGVWDPVSRSLAASVAAEPFNPTPARILADYFEERDRQGSREFSPWMGRTLYHGDHPYHTADPVAVQSDRLLAAFFRQSAAHPTWHYPWDILCRRQREMQELTTQALQKGLPVPDLSYDWHPSGEPLSYAEGSWVGHRLLNSPLLESVERVEAVTPRGARWDRSLTLRGGTLFFRTKLGIGLGRGYLTPESHPLLGGLLITGGDGGSLALAWPHRLWMRGLILILRTAADADFYVALLNRLVTLSRRKGTFLRYLEVHLLRGIRADFWQSCSSPLLRLVQLGRRDGFPLRVALRGRVMASYRHYRHPDQAGCIGEAAQLGSLRAGVLAAGGPAALVQLPEGKSLYS